MAEWEEVEITGTCSFPREDTLLVPQGRAYSTRLVVERGHSSAGGSTKIVGGGVRTDPGEGACVLGELLQALGGEGAHIRYRAASFIDVLRYKPSVLLQFLVVVLTLISTLISAYSAYLTNISDPSKTFAYGTATVVMVIALVLAVAKFVIDYRKL
jgi:hypothetical protein